ncbi:MAG: phosphoribosylamine--glycine ligase [Bauldia sp.]|nr:phosphoribosylamine--glycine ligase [Bauldia sp.]
MTGPKLNVLLIGGGGREHALACKLAQSPRLGRLHAAPGNPGIAQHAELVALDIADHADVVAFCRSAGIGLVVIGPEGPLVAGLTDALADAGIAAFGPSRAAAALEGSKGFTKALCDEAGIPTARYARFHDAAAARTYVTAEGAPIVVKADGLAAGKGVVVAETVEEALAAVDACFSGEFGSAGAAVVVEEKMTGVEASLFALSDGATVIPFGTAQDYKRAFDGDTGPNTGGMGAISPAPALSADLAETAMATIVRPAIAAMRARGTPFRGVLYAGLMLTADGPKLVEFNVRFGDPECQVLMRRLESDLLDLLDAAAHGRLASAASPAWRDETAVTVVMAAKGYPGAIAKGSVIRGVERANALPGVTVFQAGTAGGNGALTATGGRVLAVTGTGTDTAAARRLAYEGVAAIAWPEGFYRRDIGL